jgi:hypothetical protein
VKTSLKRLLGGGDDVPSSDEADFNVTGASALTFGGGGGGNSSENGFFCLKLFYSEKIVHKFKNSETTKIKLPKKNHELQKKDND